jgi:hypothetical protein
MAQIFTFTLDSFKITDTRSRHNDTDYVTFTLLVKSAAGVGTPKTLTKSMGDVNNGVHKVNLSFGNIPINPTDTVVLNYLIVNTGSKEPNKVFSALEDSGTKLANEGVNAAAKGVGDAVNTLIPGFGTLLTPALEAAGGWFVGELKNLLNANCDGLVAAEQNTLHYDDMMAKTAKGTFTQLTKHPGTNSPHGCGSNSVYYVTWYMQSHP